MPFKPYSPITPPTQPPSSFVDKLRALGGAGIRIGSGWLASAPAMEPGIGSLLGGAIAGAGELAAEGVEGSPLSLKQAGISAALGAVPLGMVFKPGQVAQSAIRSGALAGVGEVGREGAHEEELDPWKVGTATATGGLVGGALGKLIRGEPPTVRPPTRPPPYQVETTAVPGGQVLSGGKISRGTGNRPDKLTGAKLGPVKGPTTAQVNAPVRPPTPPPEPTPLDFSSREAYLTSRGIKPDYALPDDELARVLDELGGGAAEGGRVPYTGSGAHPSGSAAKSQVREVETAHSVANKLRKEELAAAANQTRLDKIQQTIDAGNMTAKPASVSESVSAKTGEGGTLRQSTAYKRPKAGTVTRQGGEAPGPDDLDDISDFFDEGAAGFTPRVGPTAPPAPAGPVMATESFIERLRKLGFNHLAQRVANNEVTEEEAIKVAAMKTAMERTPEAPIAAAPSRPLVPEAPTPPAVDNLDDIRQAAEAPIPTPQVRAARGVKAKVLTPRQQAQQQSLDDLRTRMEAEGQATPPPEAPSTTEFDAAKNRQVNEQLTGKMGELTDEEIRALDSVDDFGKPLSAADRGIEEVVPAAAPEEPQSALAKFFKSPVDAAGEAFRAAKGEADINPLAKRQLGIALGTEAQKAGLPTKGVKPDTLKKFLEGHVSPAISEGMGRPPLPAEVPPKAPPVASEGPSLTRSRPQAEGETFPTPGPVPEQWVQDELKTVDQLSKAQSLANRLKGESGAVDPEFLALLAKTGIGAAAGGVIGGAAGHPFLGMAAGAGLANAPAILSQLGAHPSTFENLQDKVNTEGIKATAQKIYQTLPQIQRFDFLSSPSGIIANAGVGPYGSAVMGAIEHGLSGDSRGWAALRMLTPKRFGDEFMNSYREAKELIARGEMGRGDTSNLSPGLPLPSGGTFRPLEAPGVAMSQGDVAARKILIDAGFTEDEARRITLTSEPEAHVPRTIANLGRGKKDWSSPLMDMMLPFKRTPANIWEQGAQRFPGLGSIVQSQRELPDPLKQQIVQQIMSGGLMAGSAFIGANLDPETAKTARRFMTNFAGQYSLPVTMGLAAGQAMAGDKPVIPAAVTGGITQLPLPATQSVEDLIGFLSGNRSAPRGAIPFGLYDRFAAPAASTTGGLDPIPGVPSLRSLRGQ